jgi:outer membrane biosynthesis protein TonB
MTRREQAPVRRTAIALCCLFIVGCAAMDPEPHVSEARAASTDAVADPPAVTEAPPAPPPAASAPTASAAPPPAVEPTPPRPPPAPVTAPPSATPRAPAASAATAPPVPASPPRVATPATPSPAPVSPSPATAPAAAVRPTAAPLDFSGLGTRLRETKAIGMLTKISVKNQADDLLEEFRAYHTQQNTSPTLTELRRAYDMLLLKLLSLLQDGDPPLANDIDSSRAAIWDFLVDPKKFVASNLMAGA